MSQKKSILFLHKYGRKAASYRYRFEQYFPFLKKSGFEIRAQSLIDDGLLEKGMEKGYGLFSLAWAYLERIFFLLPRKNDEILILYMDALPMLPFSIEWWLILKGRSYFVDLDDAIYLRYSRHRNPLVRSLLKKKFEQLFRNAEGVFAGNQYLAEYAGRFCSSVIVVPTVIDLDSYEVKTDFSEAGALTIGWVGSPSTSAYLKSVLKIIKPFVLSGDARLLLVGSGRLEVDFPVEFRDWDLGREVADILDIDVGIMPLEEDEWSQGKCGFKLIQYMGCGLPVISSPVGVNKEIVDEGVNGYLCKTEEEWANAIQFFVKNRNKLSVHGLNGRKKVEANYSVKITSDLLLNEIQKA